MSFTLPLPLPFGVRVSAPGGGAAFSASGLCLCPHRLLASVRSSEPSFLCSERGSFKGRLLEPRTPLGTLPDAGDRRAALRRLCSAAAPQGVRSDCPHCLLIPLGVILPVWPAVRLSLLLCFILYEYLEVLSSAQYLLTNFETEVPRVLPPAP